MLVYVCLRLITFDYVRLHSTHVDAGCAPSRYRLPEYSSDGIKVLLSTNHADCNMRTRFHLSPFTEHELCLRLCPASSSFLWISCLVARAIHWMYKFLNHGCLRAYCDSDLSPIYLNKLYMLFNCCVCGVWNQFPASFPCNRQPTPLLFT